MQSIKNIVFDLGGVLVGLDGSKSIEAYDKLGCQAVSKYIEEHRTEDLFYRIELGLISTHDYCEEIRQMTNTHATDEEMIQAWNLLLTELSTLRREKLLSLRQQGYRLFLLSNTNDMHWQHCASNLFGNEVVDAFDQIFLSYEMNLSKPDAAIFSAVINEANLLPSETLFIDDNRQNIEAAASLGIHTYLNTSIDNWVEEIDSLL
ncbi:MAG: HAD family phosphatase [Prevotella sp.]|nr:HAD family phosphatase [Prevotella sp.]